jgi:hypothetical protein
MKMGMITNKAAIDVPGFLDYVVSSGALDALYPGKSV